MASGDVRNSKRFRELAALLREQADSCGPSLLSGRSNSAVMNWCWHAASWSAPSSGCGHGSGDAHATRTLPGKRASLSRTSTTTCG
jgi:hypothetical protein